MALVTVSGAHLHPQALEDQTPTVSAAPHSALKSILRTQARARRNAIAADGAADLLAGHLLRLLVGAIPAVVAGYWPIGSEIDPRPALARLSGQRARIALPETGAAGTALRFRLWNETAALSAGPYGTRHADGPEIVPNLLLVPLLAFDACCHRLGYGGGYYDRTLAALPNVRAIGCAYAAQQIAAIPLEPTDQPLHAIATERGVLFPRR